MSDNHFVIIGNGVSANRAAAVIRKHDDKCRITMVSDEIFPFYYRHLLCSYIIGEQDEENLLARSPEHYKENRIKLRLGQKVLQVDLARKLLFLGHKEKLWFTKLLICSGGKPYVPEIYLPFKPFFTFIQTLSHARIMRQQLSGIKKVLLVGGDLISVRMAADLLKRDIEVSMLIDQNSFWPLELTNQVKEDFVESLTEEGVTVMADDALSCIEKSGTRYRVKTAGKKDLEVDMIGAFFGLRPNVGFLADSGLHIERGILVDEFLQTNIDGVYAAGDCAQVYNPEIRNYWVSIGWENAKRLGEIAGLNMIGEAMPIKRPQLSILDLNGVTVATEWWKGFK